MMFEEKENMRDEFSHTESTLSKKRLKQHRIRMIRYALNKSRKNFAEFIGIPYNTFLCWDTGRTELTLSGGEKIIQGLSKAKLQCSIEWLMGETHGPLPIQDRSIESSINSIMDIHYQQSFYQNNPDYLTLTVVDRSMKEFPAGINLVGKVKDERTEVDDLLGKIVLCKLSEDGKILARILYPSDKDGCCSLVATNPYSQVPILKDLAYDKIALIINYKL